MKPIVEDEILRNLPITNGSETYKYWKDPPVHPTMYMYFFNLTNEKEFLRGEWLNLNIAFLSYDFSLVRSRMLSMFKTFSIIGEEKPKLVQLGPYVYVQNMKKTNITFSKDESEVTYSVKRDYFFSPEHSSGPESDIIVVPNIPLFGAMKKLTK